MLGSTPDITTPDLLAWHHLVLRLAGRLPDDLISEARTWIGAGNQTDAAAAIAFAAASSGVPLLRADLALVAAALADAGDPGDAVEAIPLAEVDYLPPFEFAPVGPEVLERFGEQVPQTLDLLAPHPDELGPDEIDNAAVAAATAQPGVRALWRTWRYPAGGSPWPKPRRLYLALLDQAAATDAGESGVAGLPAVTARLQAALIAAGETDPQVEATGDDDPMPEYQRRARACSALLWSRAEAPPVRLARVFDRVDPQSGPAFDDDHPRLTDPDQVRRVLDYLNDGEIILHTTAMMDDVVDPEYASCVPVSFRTDGEWVWTETVGYYLQRYGLAPDPELTAHMAAHDHQPPAVDEVGVHRALARLQVPEGN